MFALTKRMYIEPEKIDKKVCEPQTQYIPNFNRRTVSFFLVKEQGILIYLIKKTSRF